MNAWTSVWDDGDRRVLAWAIALVLAWDLVSLTLELGHGPIGPPHPGAPAWLIAIGEQRPLSLAIALLTIAMLPVWIRRRDRLWPATVVLLGAGLLVEAAAAIGPGPWRARFFAGAMIGGDLLGRLWARGAGVNPRARDRAGEAGAVAALSASYLAAATSKMVGSGTAWADGTTLAAVALCHAPFGDASLANWIAGAPAVTRGFAIATVVIQAAGGLYWVGRASRIFVGLALVSFHVGVAAVTSIGYWQPVVLLVVFSLPWPRWISAPRVDHDHDLGRDRDRATVTAARGWRQLAGAGALLIVGAWALPWRSYTSLHHRPRNFGSDGTSVAVTPVEVLGPLRRGDDLGDGWRIAAIETMPGRAAIVIAHAQHGRARLWLGPGREDVRPSPFDGEGFSLGYDRASDPGVISVPALAIGERISNAAPIDWEAVVGGTQTAP